MYLVQILLPLYNNEGQAFEHDMYDRVFDELAQACGGVTAYQRSPAKGAWKAHGQGVCHDEVVVFEVMVETLDRPWWQTYRRDLERRFQQDRLLVRAIQIEEV
jgi:hypothetical protein